MDIAVELAHFVAEPVGVVDRWATWTDHADLETISYPQGPRVAIMTPPPCSDGGSATGALEQILSRHATDFSRVLVDLSDYAPAGELPTAAEFVDGIVFLVRRRRARISRISELARLVPRSKTLAAILVG